MERNILYGWKTLNYNLKQYIIILSRGEGEGRGVLDAGEVQPFSYPGKSPESHNRSVLGHDGALNS